MRNQNQEWNLSAALGLQHLCPATALLLAYALTYRAGPAAFMLPFVRHPCVIFCRFLFAYLETTRQAVSSAVSILCTKHTPNEEIERKSNHYTYSQTL